MLIPTQANDQHKSPTLFYNGVGPVRLRDYPGTLLKFSDPKA